jgi:hypothetical protein
MAVEKMKIEKNSFIKSVIASIISNFCIIGFIGFLTVKPFRYFTDISAFFFDLLFGMGEVFVTGNWLLPMLFITFKKGSSSQLIQKSAGNQTFLV